MSRPSYVRTVAPSEPLLSLDEVILHLRSGESGEENGLISGLIETATAWAEDYCWSQFVTATWVMRANCFWCQRIPLDHGPLLTVTSVVYTDTGGTPVTLTVNTDYVVDTYQKPGLIYPAYGKSWPSVRGFENDVTVTFTSGYGAAIAVPRAVKTALLMLVGHWYQSRTAAGCDTSEIPFGVKPLLDNYSFRVFT